MSREPWVDGLTIGETLDQTAARFDDREAVVFPQADVRWTWRQFQAKVDQAAKGLLALGFKRGDHFGVWSTNWPEWVVLQFATARIGVVLVTVNPSYRSDELAYAIKQSDIRGLALIEHFKTTHYDQVLRDAWPGLNEHQVGQYVGEPFPKLQWLIRMRGSSHPAMLDWDEFLMRGESIGDDQLKSVASQVKPTDPVNLQYTSGTTGKPKGALLTHRNLLLNAYYAGECQRLTSADRICVSVPLYHCFGCVLGTLCAAVHATAMVFPHESFAADKVVHCIEEQSCTVVYGVPTMFIAMFEQLDRAPHDLRSLRTGIMAGSPCPIELMKRVTNEMGVREITIAYGQTEASPLITMTRTDDPIEKRVSTVGRVIPGVEAKIVDVETGKTLPDNTSGELCARGHNVMLGYYNDPEATKKAIDGEGWLHTGDLALRQPDGYYRITGRLKDTIIRGGENISPREIEELLYQHPAVQDVQVIGVPDSRFGEQVLAAIIRRPGIDVSESEIKQYCRQHLAHFKTPHYVWFVDEFPTTVTGKVQKFKLRQQAIEHFSLTDVASISTA